MRNPLVKPIARWYSKQCPRCGTPRIEAVLHSYNEKITCPECTRHLKSSNIMMKTALRYLKMESGDLGDLSSDPEAMTLINALCRGIASQGQRALDNGLPLYVVFDVTSRCNLQCIHCYSSEKRADLSTSEVSHVIQTLFEAGAGVMDFGGGEPLLRKDIFDILSYAKRLGLYTSISTNGMLLDETCVNRLKALGINHVCVSLDGATAETHDRIRNKKGTFEQAIQGIKNSVSAGISTQVSTVVMNSNVTEVKDIFTLLNTLHAQGWYIYDFVPAGRGKTLQKEVLTPEQRKHLFEYLQERAGTSPIPLKPYPYLITVNAAGGAETYFYKKYGRLTEFFQGCLAGRWTCSIASNGDVFPCHQLPFSLGNLTTSAFNDIWFNTHSPVLTDLRNRNTLKGTCGDCTYREVCGGCRAQAFWRTGDYLEGDRCWIQASSAVSPTVETEV